ncbi:MAG TPA: hypothetical protein VGR27_13870 [Longimicrobiaceae bacterium]|nr:hypothetical protein [Longimicrobiaceae bacterium]
MRLALLIASAALVLGTGVLEAQQIPDAVAQQRAEAMMVQRADSSLMILAAGDGAQAARLESTARWLWGGFAGGATLGPIGAGMAWFLADNSDARLAVPRAMMLSSEVGPAYLHIYEQSYAETLHARRKRSALVGGAFGTATLGAVLLAVWATYYYY